MKKALLRFTVSSKNEKGEPGSLSLEVPLSPTKEVEPEINVSLETSFKPLKENNELFKIVTTVKLNIKIYSDYKILNKEDYYEYFNVAMNKDKPNELTISPVNIKDIVSIKPISILED
jgi:preprotein translocase subunit SecB